VDDGSRALTGVALAGGSDRPTRVRRCTFGPARRWLREHRIKSVHHVPLGYTKDLEWTLDDVYASYRWPPPAWHARAIAQ
jgi:hypothetical protein